MYNLFNFLQPCGVFKNNNYYYHYATLKRGILNILRAYLCKNLAPQPLPPTMLPET